MTHITVIIGAPKVEEAPEGAKKAPKSARRNLPAKKKAAKAKEISE
jgi:hypothetical protein